MIEFECYGCGSKFDVSDSLAGKVIKCRECHQPGKVRVPLNGSGSSAKIKTGEKAASTSSKGDYQCPFCGSRQPWEWRRHWSPSSTWLLLVGLYANFYVCWWAYSWAYQKALATNLNELDASISGSRLIWVFVILCVAVTLDVLAFRLLWERHQECPRCGVRIG